MTEYSDIITFSHDKEARFDLETYWGRFYHFQNIINPKNLLFTNKTLNGYVDFLHKHKHDEHDKDIPTNDKILWDMKYALLSNMHPQTEKPLPSLLRTSSFVIVNIPMVIGMSILPPTPFNQFFSQTMNQSYNFLFNYANRNASNQFSNTQLMVSYLSACGCAIGVSIGLATVFRKMNLNPTIKYMAIRGSPFLGVASANVCNLFFSRSQDFKNGVYLMDKETKEVITSAKSYIIAKKAFWQTALTRVLIPIPIFLLPNLYIALLAKLKLLPKSNIGSLISNAAISAFSLYVGLSGAIAIFPQTGYIHFSQLEKEFHNLKNKNGNKIEYFSFNKGL